MDDFSLALSVLSAFLLSQSVDSDGKGWSHSEYGSPHGNGQYQVPAVNLLEREEDIS